MKPALIRLIDLGIQEDFEATTAFAQSLVRSLLAQAGGNPAAEIELVRARDFYVVSAALQATAHVVHLISHSDTSPDDLGFWSDDEQTQVVLPDLAAQFADDGEGIGASTLFADCCSSAQGRFVNALRDCIAAPITYIGATRTIGWHESTTFAAAFYGAYFKDRGRGLSPAERAAKAAIRAITGYQAIVDGPCPYVVKELKPSRQARRSLSS